MLWQQPIVFLRAAGSLKLCVFQLASIAACNGRSIHLGVTCMSVVSAPDLAAASLVAEQGKRIIADWIRLVVMNGVV